MLLTLSRVLVCVLLLSGAARAQAVVDYDPGFLPQDLRLMTVEACGVQVGADPTWPRSAVREVMSDGKTRVGEEFVLDPDYWKSRGEKPGDFVVNPYFSLSVTCFPTTLSDKGMKGFADRVHASAKKRANTKPKRIKTFKAEGLGKVYTLRTVTTGRTEAQWGAINDQVSFYAVHKGQLVTVRVYIRRQPPSVYVVDLRKGDVITRTDKNGEEVKFRLTAPALQNILGTEIAATRPMRANDALFERIRTSLRGL
mmetsp:Transcript_13496/g.21541  ORF Transcript_13496/g.21541 Transcript_13496/m.21541 type:complete len:254 (-) Transcript_13496:2565-3326(-)